MSTADGGRALQWSDSGTADRIRTLLAPVGGTYKIRNTHNGKLLAIAGNSPLSVCS
ncbi:hypothetical protein [Streptomyces sp. NPDC002324]